MLAKRLMRRFVRAQTVFADLGTRAVIQRVVRRILPSSLGTENKAHGEWVREQQRSDAEFDIAHGTQTGGIVEIFDLTIVGENQRHGLLYAATRPDDFDRIFRSLDIVQAHDFTFVDLGCGKGRTLVLASRLSFKRIIGVEFAVELVEVAKKNILKLKESQPGRNVEVVLADAAEYELPVEPLVIYVFNAFGSAIIQRVARNVHSAWQKNPRPIIFVYMNPVHLREFADDAWLQLPSPFGCVVLTPK